MFFLVITSVVESADGSYGSIIDEEISTRWPWWEAMEMEEESSSMASTIQMEVAKTLETVGMD